MIDLTNRGPRTILLERFRRGRDDDGRHTPAAIVADLGESGRGMAFRGRQPANRLPPVRLALWAEGGDAAFAAELSRIPSDALGPVGAALLADEKFVHVVPARRANGEEIAIIHCAVSDRGRDIEVAIAVSGRAEKRGDAVRIDLLGYSAANGWSTPSTVLRAVWAIAIEPELRLVAKRAPRVAFVYGDEPWVVGVDWRDVLGREAALRGFRVAAFDIAEPFPRKGLDASFTVEFEVPRDAEISRRIRFASGRKPSQLISRDTTDPTDLAVAFGKALDVMAGQQAIRQRRTTLSPARELTYREFGEFEFPDESEERGSNA